MTVTGRKKSKSETKQIVNLPTCSLFALFSKSGLDAEDQKLEGTEIGDGSEESTYQNTSSEGDETKSVHSNNAEKVEEKNLYYGLFHDSESDSSRSEEKKISIKPPYKRKQLNVRAARRNSPTYLPLKKSPHGIGMFCHRPKCPPTPPSSSSGPKPHFIQLRNHAFHLSSTEEDDGLDSCSHEENSVSSSEESEGTAIKECSPIPTSVPFPIVPAAYHNCTPSYYDDGSYSSDTSDQCS
jgi:hypothetical protein